MKKVYFILGLTSLFLFGCILLQFGKFGCTSSEFGKFNDAALAFANNDKRIDQKEYESLAKQIKRSSENGFKTLKSENGEADDAKVLSYLLKYFKAKKIELTEADIWQPKQQGAKSLFNINVFLENSASMDGYVKGVTDFETAIYSLLGDFKISGLCDSLNLNYINSKSIPYSKKNALPADIQDFIEKLEPSIFRQRGGDRSVSDLKNILNTILKTVNRKNAAVLISDFVFSPNANANAQDYLNNQGVGIKIDFAQKLNVYDLITVVIQLQSNFDGFYYDKKDKPIRMSCKRPYYIWMFGDTKQIREILEKKILDIKGGYQNRLVLQSIKGASAPNIKIQPKATFGTFNRAGIRDGIISGATESKGPRTRGLFGFNVAVDFSSSLQDGNFYADTANYKLSNGNYHLKVESINANNSDASLSGFTHLLKLQTAYLKEEALQIDVVGGMPSWVYRSASNDDANIASDDSEKQKTFGLKYLMEGVTDAFYPKTNAVNPISSIKITIKK